VVLTTLDAAQGETVALGKIAELRARPRVMLSAEQLEHGAAKAGLSDEQTKAIETINSQSGLAVLEAGPGTGKSHSMNAVATAWREAHPRARIITVAVAGRASSELAHKVDGAEARTVESFARDRAALTADDLVLVDEASQLDGVRAVTLLSKVAGAGAFTVLLGDRTQLGKVVGSGGIFAHLADEAERDGHLAVLTENRRAIDPLDAHAWERLREGESMEALEHFDAKGLIHLDANRDQALHRAIEGWAADQMAGKDTVMVTDGANAQIDLLNSFARDKLIAAGQVQTDKEVVIGFKDGDYHRTEQVSVGDEVTLVQTSYLRAIDPKWHTVSTNKRVHNGERLRVVDARAGGIVVERQSHQQVIVPGDRLERLRLGYAISAYRSQGITVDTAHVVTGHWNTKQEAAVVSMTRARERSEVYSAINDLIDWPAGMRTAEAEKLALRALGERFGASDRDEMVSDQIERWKAAHETALEEQVEVSRIAHQSQQMMAESPSLQRAA
jgi:ATP-dependent exoDNAse (exonuclease V) alpha subunit